MELMLPALRSDITLCETYQYAAEPPLDCPIFVYGGAAASDVTPFQLAAWRQQTRQVFRSRMFPGSHFFIEQSRVELGRAIERDLSSVLS